MKYEVRNKINKKKMKILTKKRVGRVSLCNMFSRCGAIATPRPAPHMMMITSVLDGAVLHIDGIVSRAVCEERALCD